MNKLITSAFFVLIITSACHKEQISLVSKTKRLVDKKWRIESCIDTTTNTSFEIPNSSYEFKETGDFIVYTESSEVHYANWEFVDDEYLKIGSNTYKLSIITSKLLGLRYGSLEIFYVPVD
ncbi:MAG: hypothetical protein ABIJ97_05790 [Bacteroidota bacterium]